MFKLILHGGGEPSSDCLNLIKDQIDVYLDEKNYPTVNALVIPFARAAEDWTSVFLKYQSRYSFLGDRVVFNQAKTDLLKTQVLAADIVFMSGGSEELLRGLIGDLKIADFDSKVIVASSASTNIFSSSYYSNDRSRVEAGYFALPFKTICHFNAERQKCLNELSAFGDNLPIFAILEDTTVSLVIS